MKNKTVLIVVLVLVVLIGAVAIAYPRLSREFTAGQLVTQPSEPQDTGSETTEPAPIPAPDFTAYDRDGKPVKLSDFKGKPVVLNFWSSNCGPCRHEMPIFQEAYDKLGEEIHFVMLNMTDNSWDTLSSAQAFIDKEGYSFPVYFDTDLEAAIAYGIHALPTTYFINSDGSMVTYASGALTAEVLQMGIDMIR